MKMRLAVLTCAWVGLATGVWGADTALLPTSHSGPWSSGTLPDGWTQSGLGTDYAANHDGAGGGSAKFDNTGDWVQIKYDSPARQLTYWVSFFGTWTNVNVFKVQESVEGSNWMDLAVFDGANPVQSVAKKYTNSPAESSRFIRFIFQNRGANGNVALDGVALPATPMLVTLDQGNGFSVQQGTSESITATAAKGVAPYGYVWSSTLGASFYSTNGNVFTILTNAPIGSYSAKVVATDSSSTPKTGSNTVSFSVAASALKYAIAITAPVGGAVTTIPATNATSGTTVTVVATPESQYELIAVRVVDADSGSVTVTSNKFTMPAKAVTVTAYFHQQKATLPTDWSGSWANIDLPDGWTEKGLGPDLPENYDGLGGGAVRFDDTNDYLQIRFDGIATQVVFHLKFYPDDGTTPENVFKVAESANGTTWSSFFSFQTTGGGPDRFVAWPSVAARYIRFYPYIAFKGHFGLDGVEITGYTPVLSVDFNRTNGFNVAYRASTNVTAIGANGTPPYQYAWSSTLDPGHYTTNNNVYTILATASPGSYSATVVITDSANPAGHATNTIDFTVNGPSSLIISEVADPSNDSTFGRFVELYNAGSSNIDLAAGNWHLCPQMDGGMWLEIALTGTVASGETYVIAKQMPFSAAYPMAPDPDQYAGNILGDGNDGYFLYSGGTYSNGVLEDSYGVIGENGSGQPWLYTDRRAVRKASVQEGNPIWTASEWTIPATADTEAMTPGVHPDGAIAFSVGFDKTNGFVIEQGQMGIIYATAVNGTAPYTYSWSCSLPAGQYLASGSLLRIENTAPPGNHSASVVATDSSMPAQMASNTVTFRITGTVPPPPIGPIVFNAGSGEFGFTVPTGYALSRVQGADTTLLASGEFNWTDLEPDVDYTEDAGQVTILTDGAAQDRMIRIWINPSP